MSTRAPALPVPPHPAPRPAGVPAGPVERVLRRAVLGRLAAVREGRLVLRDAGGEFPFGDAASPLRADVRVHDPSFWSALALRGSVGAGEAFMDGSWSADDLTAVVRIMVRNRDALEGMERGLARLAAPALRAFHALRSNSRAGSRRNVADHYDLGNEFFALFLDAGMSYSCLWFPRPDAGLEEAADAKIDRLLRAMDVRPGHRLLEIGTGWGALAMRAAAVHGCRVTTTTISCEQARLARQRIAAAGLADRVTVIERDYRDLDGTFDRLVSVEMVEAVGAERLDGFLRACVARLAPDGVMGLQAITIADHLYETALRRVDFIQRHVFPGTFIPSVAALTASVARATDLRLAAMEDIGAHYATTLRRWRERFLARREEARAAGRDEAFLRKWEYYLAYCEGGFAEGVLGDAQAVLVRPRARGTFRFA